MEINEHSTMFSLECCQRSNVYQSEDKWGHKSNNLLQSEQFTFINGQYCLERRNHPAQIMR